MFSNKEKEGPNLQKVNFLIITSELISFIQTLKFCLVKLSYIVSEKDLVMLRGIVESEGKAISSISVRKLSSSLPSKQALFYH